MDDELAGRLQPTAATNGIPEIGKSIAHAYGQMGLLKHKPVATQGITM